MMNFRRTSMWPHSASESVHARKKLRTQIQEIHRCCSLDEGSTGKFGKLRKGDSFNLLADNKVTPVTVRYSGDSRLMAD